MIGGQGRRRALLAGTQPDDPTFRRPGTPRTAARPTLTLPGRVAGVAALAAMLIAGCGGSDDTESTAAGVDRTANPNEAGDSTESGGGAELIESERQAVVEAHRAAMQARIDSAAPPTPQPDDPAVAETHVDPMLTEWTSRLRGLESQGLAIRYPEDSELEVEPLNVTFGWQDPADAGDAAPDEVGDLATMEACIVDDGEIVRVATGEVTQGGGLYTIHETATLHKVDGTWRLAERQPHSERPGRTGCAAQ